MFVCCVCCRQNYTGITSAGLARRYFRIAGPLASTYDPSENNGEELPESALAHRILASALSQARLDDIAIVLQDAVLKMIADSPNVNKLHLIQQFAQLGGSLQNQGNFKRAIEVQSRALEDSIAFQGMADRETRQLMMNQGNAMRSVCNHEKSCTLLKQAWDLYKEHDGEDHIDTLNAQMNYASTLMHFSDHVLKAEELMRDCYTKHSRIYGAEHQRTLITATNLYLVLLRQSLSESGGPIRGKAEKLSEGMELNKKTYQAKVRVLGYNHFSSLLSGKHYGTNLGSLGRHKEAVSILEQVYKIGIRENGKEHAQSLNTALSLVTLKFKLSCDVGILEWGVEAADKLEAEAWELGEETLALYTTIYGPDYQETKQMSAVLEMERMLSGLEDELMDIPPCPGCDDPNCKANQRRAAESPEP